MAGMSKRTHDIIYAILEERDGERCYICHKTLTELEEAGKEPKLQIEDVTGSGTHTLKYVSEHLKDYHLACRTCNAKKGRREYKIPSSDPITKNQEYEQKWRDWVDEQYKLSQNDKELIYQDRITKRHLIEAGAEYVGCSIQTTRRYLAKLTSIEGSYKLVGNPPHIEKREDNIMYNKRDGTHAPDRSIHVKKFPPKKLRLSRFNLND